MSLKYEAEEKYETEVSQTLKQAFQHWGGTEAGGLLTCSQP